jgi:hypothetical protein
LTVHSNATTAGEAVESCDLTAQNNAFLFIIDFYIVETLYKPVTIANGDHAVEASMVN